MKIFTERQIATFKDMINKGILNQIEGDPELCRTIAKGLYNIEEGYFIFENLATSEVINEWDARGETYELVENIINYTPEGKEVISSILKEHMKDCEIEINRKTMIKLLGLRDFATKEDILKELNEIL